MKNPISVTKLKASKGHGHPSFDIRWQKYERPVFDDEFKVCVKKLEYQIEVRF